MSARLLLGGAIALTGACIAVPVTPMAPATPAVRLLIDPPRDVRAVTADGDSLVFRDAAELLGRVVWETDDSITVMVTTVRRAAAESPSGVKSGTVVALRRDPAVRVEVISEHPRTVEYAVTGVTVGLILLALWFLSQRT